MGAGLQVARSKSVKSSKVRRRATGGRRATERPGLRRLQESSTQFRLAQEALGIVTWIWEPGTDRVQWYGDMSRMLGLPPGGFGGRFGEYLRHVHPEDAARARQVYVDCLKGRTPEYRTEDRVVWPDGSVHWLETYGRASYGKNGRARQLTGVIKDITPRKQIARAHDQAEQLISRVFEASPDYISITRQSDGRILAVNPAFERVTGFRAREVVGRTVQDVGFWVSPSERDAFRDELRQQGAVYDQPIRFRVNGGRVVSGLLSASVIEQQSERVVVAVVHDTSELKRLEQRYRQTERNFAALFESNPEAIVITRLNDAVILALNAAWERYSGHRRDEVLGRSAFDLRMWMNPLQRALIVERLTEGRNVSNFEAQLRHADGSELQVLLSAAKIDMEGYECVIWSWRDLGDIRKAERQARQSLEKFSTVFDTSPAGLVVTKIENSGARIVEMNDAALKLAGVRREDVIGTDTLSIVRWEDPQQISFWRERALAGERLADVPLSFRRPDGTRVEALFSGGAIEIDGGPHMLVTMYDVTETHKQQRALAELEERFKKAFHSSQEAIGITRLSDLTMVEVNQRLEELYGATAAEVVGKPVRDLDPWVEGRATTERILAALRAEGKIRKWQLGMRTRSGEIRQVVYNADLIEIAGEPHVIAFLRDETELLEAERKRRESEALLMDIARGVSTEMGDAFFRSLVEHLAKDLGADVALLGELVEPAGDRVRTLAVIEDGQLKPNFEYLLEGSPCAGVAQRHGTVVIAERVGELFPNDAGLRRLGVHGYIGTSLFGTHGGPLGILVVMSRRPIERAGPWASVIEIFGARAAAEIERARADARVREANASLERRVRERTAELEAANRELDSYNYSISHDLRQPLNAIAGFSELVRNQLPQLEGADASDLLDFVHEIESNAHRMELMIEALLEVARAGRSALSINEIDMNGQVDSVLRDLAHAAPLHAEISIGELPVARGDATLLRQVWSNLIGNALKYSSGVKAPEVRICGRRRGGVLEYEVGDNGVGFDMRDAHRLFGVFQRLPNSRGFQGTGVGLAIVQRIVRRHGGQVSAESAPGLGTRIRFTLPA